MEAFLDHGKLIGAYLTDLSKGFDNLPRDILIAKLNAHGFDFIKDKTKISSLQIKQSYLTNRHQRTKKVPDKSSSIYRTF